MPALFAAIVVIVYGEVDAGQGDIRLEVGIDPSILQPFRPHQVIDRTHIPHCRLDTAFLDNGSNLLKLQAIDDLLAARLLDDCNFHTDIYSSSACKFTKFFGNFQIIFARNLQKSIQLYTKCV